MSQNFSEIATAALRLRNDSKKNGKLSSTNYLTFTAMITKRNAHNEKQQSAAVNQYEGRRK
jgi:hypothetical protein